MNLQLPYPQVQLDKYDEMLAPFKDKDGLIGHVQSDGNLDFGDSFQRFGFDAIGRFLFVLSRESTLTINQRAAMLANVLLSYQKKLPLYEVIPHSGIYARHPRQWSDQKELSRDQETPNNIFMSWTSGSSSLVRTARSNVLWNRVKRLGKYQNKDYTSPEQWMFLLNNSSFPMISIFCGIEMGLIISTFISPKVVFGLLFMPGTFFLINSIVRVYSSHRDHDDVGDDLNYLAALMHFKVQNYYSPLILIGEWIYCQFRWRPKSYRVLNLSCSGAMYALDHYFRGYKNPPINHIWNLLLPYYIKGRHFFS